MTVVLYVQNNALLVFCWPLDLPDAPAIKLAHTISDLLSSVLGPVAGWSENNACKAHGPQAGQAPQLLPHSFVCITTESSV